MTKTPKISEQDQALFRDAMRGVKPIKQSKIVKPKVNIDKVKKEVELEEVTEKDEFSDFENLPLVSGDDLIEFARIGLQHKVLRNLRNGKYNVEATLDLHGMTVAEARTALSQFLVHCQHRRIRHVLIIHGKGHTTKKPILKNKLNHWLRQTNSVLAFCSATIREGRSGALYALLKIGSTDST